MAMACMITPAILTILHIIALVVLLLDELERIRVVNHRVVEVVGGISSGFAASWVGREAVGMNLCGVRVTGFGVASDWDGCAGLGVAYQRRFKNGA